MLKYCTSLQLIHFLSKIRETMYGNRPITGSLANRPSSRIRNLDKNTHINGNKPPTSSTGRISTASTRQVHDAAYIKAELKNLIGKLAIENIKMSTEITKITNDVEKSRVYDREANQFAQELRDLQSKLADLNTLIDKHQLGLCLSQIQEECQSFIVKNRRLSSQQDKLFKHKIDLERAFKAAEIEMVKRQLKMDQSIAQLGMDKVQEYEKLKHDTIVYNNMKPSNHDIVDPLNNGSLFVNDSTKMHALLFLDRLYELKHYTQDIIIKKIVSNGTLSDSQVETSIEELNLKINALKNQDLDKNYQNFQILVQKDKALDSSLRSLEDAQSMTYLQFEEVQNSITAIKSQLAIMDSMNTDVKPSKSDFKNLMNSLEQSKIMQSNRNAELKGIKTSNERTRQELENIVQLETNTATDIENIKAKIMNLKSKMDELAITGIQGGGDTSNENVTTLYQKVQTVTAELERRKLGMRANPLLDLDYKLHLLISKQNELKDLIAQNSFNDEGLEHVLDRAKTLNQQLVKIEQMRI